MNANAYALWLLTLCERGNHWRALACAHVKICLPSGAFYLVRYDLCTSSLSKHAHTPAARVTSETYARGELFNFTTDVVLVVDPFSSGQYLVKELLENKVRGHQWLH